MNWNIKEKLKHIIHYYGKTRRVGHTKTMIRGAQNVDKVMVLGANEDHVRLLKREIPNSYCVSITNLDSFRGVNYPLLIDNSASDSLMRESLFEIDRLENRSVLENKGVNYIQWNINILPAIDCKDHYKVRSTSYGEIYSLLGTSGCSTKSPWWSWYVMGIIEEENRIQVVCPNDYIVDFNGISLVLTHDEFNKLKNENV